jgi:hypothetical protein
MFAHAVKVYRRRRDIAPLILNLGTRWEWSFDASTALSPRKVPQIPVEYFGWVASERRRPSFMTRNPTAKQFWKKFVCCIVLNYLCQVQTKLLMEFRVIVAVCCDDKRNTQVRIVVKMQDLMLKQVVHMFAILHWVFMQQSEYLQIALELERQNE